MKELTRQIILIVVLILALFGATYWAQTKISRDDNSVSFAHTGMLERNTPDVSKSDTWFLHYEADSNGRGALAEIALKKESLCQNLADDGFSPCEGSISSYGIVHVDGRILQDVLTVSKISVIQPSDPAYPNGEQAAYHKSDVFGYYGTIALKGYLNVEKHVCNPGDMCSATVDYANFVFNKTDNPSAPDDLFTGYDNPFVGAGYIGLGCYEKNKKQITYQNNSDLDVHQGSIQNADLTKLLSSSATKLVEMKLTKMVITTGKGAPDCYSTFRNFDVL